MCYAYKVSHRLHMECFGLLGGSYSHPRKLSEQVHTAVCHCATA